MEGEDDRLIGKTGKGENPRNHSSPQTTSRSTSQRTSQD